MGSAPASSNSRACGARSASAGQRASAQRARARPRRPGRARRNWAGTPRLVDAAVPRKVKESQIHPVLALESALKLRARVCELGRLRLGPRALADRKIGGDGAKAVKLDRACARDVAPDFVQRRLRPLRRSGGTQGGVRDGNARARFGRRDCRVGALEPGGWVESGGGSHAVPSAFSPSSVSTFCSSCIILASCPVCSSPRGQHQRTPRVVHTRVDSRVRLESIVSARYSPRPRR